MMHTVGKLGRQGAQRAAVVDQFRKSFDDMTKEAELDELRNEIQRAAKRTSARRIGERHASESILPVRVVLSLRARIPVPPITGTRAARSG